MDTSITALIFLFSILAAGGAAIAVYALTRLVRRARREMSRLELGLEDLRIARDEAGHIAKGLVSLNGELGTIKETLSRNFLTDLVHLNRNHWHDVSPRRVCLPDHAFRMPGYYGGL
jgi:hypothetical protein